MCVAFLGAFLIIFPFQLKELCDSYDHYGELYQVVRILVHSKDPTEDRQEPGGSQLTGNEGEENKNDDTPEDKDEDQNEDGEGEHRD